jgi:hypothetical protein
MKGAPLVVSNQDVASLMPFVSELASAGRPILWTAPGVLPRQTARALARAKQEPSLIGIADHFEVALLTQIPLEFEDLRALDEEGLAATVEQVAVSNGRVVVTGEVSVGSFGLFAPHTSLALLRDYLDEHPASLIICAVRLSASEVSEVRALS